MTVSESTVSARRILCGWNQGLGVSFPFGSSWESRASDTFEEERRELLESVVWDLRTGETGCDRLAVDRHLLAHLATASPL